MFTGEVITFFSKFDKRRIATFPVPAANSELPNSN